MKPVKDLGTKKEFVSMISMCLFCRGDVCRKEKFTNQRPCLYRKKNKMTKGMKMLWLMKVALICAVRVNFCFILGTGRGIVFGGFSDGASCNRSISHLLPLPTEACLSILMRNGSNGIATR